MTAHADLLPHAAGLCSPRLSALGVPHIFGDRRHNVQTPADARALADAADLAPGPVFLGTQCHGRIVTTPATRDATPQADAHLTDRPGDLVAVRTADCVPVLLASAQGRCVAAVHAGWRGLVAGVIQAAVHAMQQRGTPPIAAAIGPCIGVDAYEVGPEVAEQFTQAHVRRGQGPRPHLNLKQAAIDALVQSGVFPEHIDVSTACTHRDTDELFSYRRAVQDNSSRGHQAAMIAPASR